MTTNKQEYIENLTGDKNKAAATFSEATTKLIQAEDAIRIELAKLDVKKKNIEHEADAVFLELTTPPAEGVDPMGIDTPLVDGDGYPRGDIDLYRCRILRHRFRELKTDHHETSSAIESMLVQLSALKKSNQLEDIRKEMDERRKQKPKPKYDPITGKWVVMNWDGTIAGVPGGENRNFVDLDRELSGMTGEDDSTLSNSLPSSRVSSTQSITNYHHETRPQYMSEEVAGIQKPYARVDAVATESPAHKAGLLEEDLIVSFGPLHSENNDSLRAIAALVLEAAEKGESIEIRLMRRKGVAGHVSAAETDSEWEKVTLLLKPRPWQGRGLLGCHILPYSI